MVKRQSKFIIISVCSLCLAAAALLAQGNPFLSTWRQIKNGLAESPDYWSNLKDSELPMLMGTVVSMSPADKPTEVMIAISTSSDAEVKLNFSTPFPNAVPLGTALAFQGVAKDFSKTPFILTIQVSKRKLHGWPAPARP